MITEEDKKEIRVQMLKDLHLVFDRAEGEVRRHSKIGDEHTKIIKQVYEYLVEATRQCLIELQSPPSQGRRGRK